MSPRKPAMLAADDGSTVAGLTLLLGMNNPYGFASEGALVPAPERCSGWRLWKMLDDAAPGGVSREAYLAGFDRLNVLPGSCWDARAARAAGAKLLTGLAGRRIVICGVQTLAAIGFARPSAWCRWTWSPKFDERIDYCLIPHPSGLCRAYNDHGVRESVKALLLGEFTRGRASAAAV